MEAPQIRRIFSSSPRDPRYHMLEHLSPKFRMTPVEREPRAALLLSRFSINLPVIFATDAIELILGLKPGEILEKPFYDCIQQNCLPDAIECLESAKSNESIAYLRFWYRDPRTADAGDDVDDDADSSSSSSRSRSSSSSNSNNSSSNSDSEGGGARLNTHMDIDDDEAVKIEAPSTYDTENVRGEPLTAHSSGAVPHRQTPLTSWSAATPAVAGPNEAGPSRRRRQRQRAQPVELEAVVSCSSDALVVVLRRARPPVPSLQPTLPASLRFENGLFAAPWGLRPIEPQYPPEAVHSFRAPLLPQYMPLREHVKQAGGPPLDQLMRSIQDVAVFAWALVGINGNLASYSRGLPRGGAQPPDGLPIWDPNAGQTGHEPPECYPARRWAQAEMDQGHFRGSLRHGAYGSGGHGYHLAEPGPTRYGQQVLPMPRGDSYTHGGGDGIAAFHHPQVLPWPQPGQPYMDGARPSYDQSHTWQLSTPPAFTDGHGQMAAQQHPSQHPHSLQHHMTQANPTRECTHIASYHPPPHHKPFTPPASNESGDSFLPPPTTALRSESLAQTSSNYASTTLPATTQAPRSSDSSAQRGRYVWQ